MTLIGATARYAARMRGPLIPRRTDRGFRLAFGSDYEDGRRVRSSAPSSACAGPDRPSGFSRPPVRVLRCREHVPSPSRTLSKAAGKSNFSRSMPLLGSP